MSSAVTWLSLACLAKVRMNSWLGAALGVSSLAADGFEALEQVVGGEGAVSAYADHRDLAANLKSDFGVSCIAITRRLFAL